MTYPRVLIVGRVAWTEGQSTLSSIFQGYPPDKLAYICIETHEPDFSRCANHFQISEIALVKKLFKWNTKTGSRRLPQASTKEVKSLEQKEASTLGWVRKHRSSFFLYVRESLWRLGGWKTKELKEFIGDFKPGVLFFVGDPLPLMNRLQRYVMKHTKLPAVIFLMDDVWSYNGGFSLLRYMLRKEVKKLIPACQAHFAISEMMKREYDGLFNINCIILTKSIAPRMSALNDMELHHPIQMVYTGKLIYGRDKSLAKVAEALSEINADGDTKAELHIYTQTEITPQLERSLSIDGSSYLNKPVPYSEVARILDASDIVMFVESLEDMQKYIARLSFSTKVTDYLASGKCILAVGAADIAPIEYLRDNNAAQICTSYNEIPTLVRDLIEHSEKIPMLAQNAYRLGQEKHGEALMRERLLKALNAIINEKKMRKKKICFVVSAPGTAIAFLKDHFERLSQYYDVYLVANFSDESEIAGLKLAGCKSIQIERRPNIKADLKALRDLRQYFKEQQFVCVQSQASKPSLLMAIAAKQARVPIRIRIFTGQIWCNMTGVKRKFYKAIDRLTVRRNTHLLADGKPQMEYLIEQGIVKRDKIKVLGNGSICGVDMSKFNPTDVVRDEVRKELGYNEENVVYTFLGRLKREKGIKEILSAFNRLVSEKANARLLFIGIDEENCHDWLIDYSNLKEGENVIFYGYTKEPFKMLQAGDVYVLPSYREGFGMSVLEASCMKLPVICSDIYGMADTFVDGETGLKCKVRDDVTLYECMLKLYGDKELRMKMGVAGRERVEKLFPKELVTEAWLEYYMNLVR